MLEKAAQKRFTPNIWFGSVERLVLRTFGMGTITYVRNLNNYYITYWLPLGGLPQGAGPSTAGYQAQAVQGQEDPAPGAQTAMPVNSTDSSQPRTSDSV